MAVVVKDRICKQCGKTFPGGPRAWYCPECRDVRKRQQAAIRRQRLGPNRPLGSIDHCAVCGKEYIVRSGLQKYCKDCAKAAVAEKDRAASLAYYRDNKDAINPTRYEKRRVKEKTCVVCGKTFDPHGASAETCSDDCKIARKRQKQQEADRKRAEKKEGYEIKKSPHEYGYVTVAEYALASGIKPSGVNWRIRNGKIPGVIRLGKCYYIPMSSLHNLDTIK